MNNSEKYYKLKLCNFYEKHGKCNKGDKCTYAHGLEELNKYNKNIIKCKSGLKCYNKDCSFIHPEGWDYKNNINNIKICEYYKNRSCLNEKNCKFKHVDYEINNENEINLNEIKQHSENNIENIKITINRINYDDNDKLKTKIKNNDNKNVIKDNTTDNTKALNNIKKLTYNLCNDFQNIIEDFKINLDDSLDDKKIKIKMKMELNNILSSLYLFRNNCDDIIEYYDKF
jgi:hypothetical protein